ncbi:DNA polymerase III subunit beta [Candidatus Bandiella euplotis]|uniref:Beta sliding clamp n=1 Tax=Candidatus Bandiella euplotis TaxID=1664265 RepID=A0ABZ0UQ52_9RICK|nr:DNA polymerase III subunit beta [Candidatus Bandiella woodruffii]WPX97035.1 DNA polymerase III subunit beta [Candidatus Bandiella woodruffii]
MKVQVNSSELLEALGHIQSIVEKRNAKPILSNVKISTKKNKMSFYTTDLEIFAKEVIEASVAGDLTTTTPIHTFYDVLRKIGSDQKVQLIFEPSEKPVKMLIKSGLSEFILPCLSAEEFPDFEEGRHDCEFKISCSDLSYLISATKHAISYDDTKYYLNGIFLHVVEDDGVKVLRAVATDVHRLAMAEVTLPSNAALLPEIILPRKTAVELLKLIEGYQGDITLGGSPNKITAIIGNTTLVSKLIDGKFPDYNKAIPYDNFKVLEASIDQLSNAIDLVTAISSEKVKAIKLKIHQSRITLHANDKISASGTIDIPASYENEEITTAFNSRYILDILDNLTGEKVVFKLNSSDRAVLVESGSDSNCKFVLMPLKI